MTGIGRKHDAGFDMFTSYAKVKEPLKEYNPKGEFGFFGGYNVEARPRVRCISGVHGIPMSTQWKPIPYFYVTQVAQYGLEHYSRWKSPEFVEKSVEMGLRTRDWSGTGGSADTTERVFYVDQEMGPIVNVSSHVSLATPGVYVHLDKDPEMHIVQFEWLPADTSSFSVISRLKETKELVLLNYIFTEHEQCVWAEETENRGGGMLVFNYAMGGNKSEWTTVRRDVLVDVSKAVSTMANRSKEGIEVLKNEGLMLLTIEFHGNVSIKQKVTQSNQMHEKAFYSVADWLRRNQDEKGGWAVPAPRTISSLRLEEGWHSAMSQGHALSVLTRAYLESERLEYLESACEALKLFEMTSESGQGVSNKVFGNVWYEEYPTVPGVFVLNGFMYSLIGLYDMSRVEGTGLNETHLAHVENAKKLFNDGIESLKTILPIYDTGTGSYYDLRHVTAGLAPNIARWDYHVLHIYLLRWLNLLQNHKILEEVASRWADYSKGLTARHN